MTRDVAQDVAAIANPVPAHARQREVGDVAFTDMCEAIALARQDAADRMRLAWEEGDVDPLLAAIAGARRQRRDAERQIRRLIAYGREFVQPRPYTLGDLADAAGMSVSGIRTGYTHADVAAVADAVGARPREWRAADQSADHTDTLPA